MRNFIFTSSGILFIFIAGGMAVAGALDGDEMLIILLMMAFPFLFTGFWNIYQVYYEKRTNYASGEYYTFSSPGRAGIGAFYNRSIILPVFLIMFGTVSLAIIAAFMVNKYEDVAIAIMLVSFTYALVITLIFMRVLSKRLSGKDMPAANSSDDEIGFKLGMIFAGIATLGLFPLIYFAFKKSKEQK